MLSIRAQLSLILRNFKVHTDMKMEDIDLSYDFVLRSAKGYRIKLEPREERFIF